MRRALVIASGWLLLCTPWAMADEAPVFAPAVRLDPRGKTAPRVTVAPNGHRFVVTNSSSDAEVFRSVDEGRTWQRTESTIPGQQSASIDTDVIALPNG